MLCYGLIFGTYGLIFGFPCPVTVFTDMLGLAVGLPFSTASWCLVLWFTFLLRGSNPHTDTGSAFTASAGSRRAFEFLSFLLFLSSHGLLSLPTSAADGSEPLGNRQDLMAPGFMAPTTWILSRGTCKESVECATSLNAKDLQSNHKTISKGSTIYKFLSGKRYISKSHWDSIILP